MKEKTNNDKWWWAALLVITLLFVGRLSCGAQEVDTLMCKPYAIQGYIEKSTPKTIKYFAVYKDGDIQEVIPVAKSVVDSIDMCNQNEIVPNLGIVVKNGTIQRIVRCKVKVRYGKRNQNR